MNYLSLISKSNEQLAIEESLRKITELTEQFKANFAANPMHANIYPIKEEVDKLVSTLARRAFEKQKRSFWNATVWRNITFGISTLSLLAEGIGLTVNFANSADDSCPTTKESLSFLWTGSMIGTIASITGFWFDRIKDREEKLELFAASQQLQQQHYKEFIDSLKEFYDAAKNHEGERELQRCILCYEKLEAPQRKIVSSKESMIPLCIRMLPEDHRLRILLKEIEETSSKWDVVTTAAADGIEMPKKQKNVKRAWRKLSEYLYNDVKELHFGKRAVSRDGTVRELDRLESGRALCYSGLMDKMV